MAVQTIAEAAMVVRPDFSQADAGVRRGARKAGQAAGDETSKGFSEKLRDSRGKFVRDGETVGDSVGAGTSKGFTRRVTPGFRLGGRSAADSFAKGFGDNSSTFGRVIATMAAKVALASAVLAAAAPGVAHLTAALIPATGAAVALPVALGAGILAAQIFKVAISGVGDAIKAGFTGSAKQAKKALEDLPPAARRFAASIIDLKPKIDKLRASVTQRFFKPLQDDIKPLTRVYFPLLSKQAPKLAGSLGSLGDKILDTARKSTVIQAVTSLFNNTRIAVDRTKGAMAPLTLALANLIKATAPLLPGIATGFVNIATKVGGFISAASKSGQVVQVYRNAITTLRTLGAIVGNVGSILAIVWTKSNQAGGNLLTTIKNLTGQAKLFLASAQGGAAVTAVFSVLASLGDALKTGLGAALPAIAQSLALAAPLLQQFAAIAGRLVAALAPLLPAMTALSVQVLTALLPAIISLTGWLEQNQDTVKKLAPIILGLVAAQNAYKIAVGLAAVATRIWSVAVGAAKVGMAAWTALNWLAVAPVHAHTAAMLISRSTIGTWVGVKTLEFGAWLRSTGAWIAGTAATVANTAVVIANRVATLAVAAGQGIAAVATATWATVTVAASTALKLARVAMLGLSTAMRANPIGAVITILTLLVAAVVYAYNHFGWFRTAVQFAWKYIKIAAEATWNWMKNTLWPSLQKAIEQAKSAFNIFWKVIGIVWKGISLYIRTEWKIISTVFNAIKGFILTTLPNAFRTGVSAISKFWGGLRDAAKKPVAFVVNQVINPFLGGFQKIASVFGVKSPGPIPGFAAGGQPDDGLIPGTGSDRDNRVGWLRNGAGKTISNIHVATGEFIVNARDTLKALPLLRWINDGMRGGPDEVRRRLGRPIVPEPGDGSEGWAFAKGGFVGFLGDVWDAVSNPTKLIQKPFNAALSSLPGAGLVKDLLTGMGKKLIGGVMGWIKGKGGGAGGDVGKAQAFVKAQEGKPYVWASAGPGGFDCSGIVSAVYNVLKGRNPYSHTFSTGSLPGPWFDTSKKIGPLVAGWSHPGQRPAGASVGHMAGMIGGMPFESSGSVGVRVGGRARRTVEFANQGVARAQGGMVDLVKMAKVAKADFGALTLAPGPNMVYNHTGAAEPMETTRPAGPSGGGRMHPDDIEALAAAIGETLARALLGTVPASRAAARQVGKRPR